jgi:polar amino acid transport system permease protein
VLLLTFDFDEFRHLLFSGFFLLPVWTTIWVTMAAMAIGISLGFIGALAKMSRVAGLRWLAEGYLWIFRGTPILVQIIFWYDAIAELTNNVINLPALLAGVLALGVNEGAYMTEIIRAGLMSVDPGQREAARAVGMRSSQVLTHIVMPQALRIIIPPTSNQFISMLKMTSLLFTIAVPEIFATGSGFFSSDFRYFEVLSVVSIWYLVLTTGLTVVQGMLERKLGVHSFYLGSARGGVIKRMFGFAAPV